MTKKESVCPYEFHLMEINSMGLKASIKNISSELQAIICEDYWHPTRITILDESENIRVLNDGSLAIGQNVAIVTPHQIAAGYVPPSINNDDNSLVLGTEIVH